MTGKAICKPMQNISDDRAGRAGHNPNGARQKGNGLLVFRREQAFCGKFLLALFEQCHQRADASGFHIIDDDLIAGLAGKGGQLASADDFQALLGFDLQPIGHALPDHPIHHRFVVFQIEINVARSGTRHTA